ncbi:Acetylcholinesterase [Holothuria leucospilota]|uniref:Carboxylic ester hydrolase n=1 Tax=Holothuria leucospilota TaxID=206669 RepID=A0A9Q1C0S2_HOLLE|nr:Acetylcholinesterase [Holothuria leucospilota]
MAHTRTVVIFFSLCATVVRVTSDDVFVDTKNGRVKGENVHYIYGPKPSVDTYLDVFKSIPFAKPPIGDLRLRKPEPVEDWSGIWDATYFRPQCWQRQNENRTSLQDEDCLYLNIWSPDVTRTGIPVMVWIHGGAFLTGSNVYSIYDGSALVGLNDVVLASINYRLNAFGFLATGDDELLGNYGLWDQSEALKWIKENIAAFGGDPDRITIFGQSAGGASVGLHLIGQPSWNYFYRAMPISGTTVSPWAVETDAAKARNDAFWVGRVAGCGNTTTGAELAECLRGVSAEELVKAANAVTLTTTNVIPLVPVIDGEFITDYPLKLLAEGKFKQCDIFIGNTAEDGTLIVIRAYPGQIVAIIPKSDYETFTKKIKRFTYIDKSDITVDAIEQQYIDWAVADDPNSNYFDEFIHIETDEAFHCPAEHTARTYALSGNKVYRYYFNHLPSTSVWPELPRWWGIAHAEDIPFFFGWPFLDNFNWPLSEEEITLSLDMMRYYTNFAKTGVFFFFFWNQRNPNTGGDNDGEDDEESHWPEYEVPGLITKEFKPGLQDLHGVRSDYCQLWNRFLIDLGVYTESLSDAELSWREEFSRWKSEDLPAWRLSFEDYVDNKDSC